MADPALDRANHPGRGRVVVAEAALFVGRSRAPNSKITAQIAKFKKLGSPPSGGERYSPAAGCARGTCIV